MPDLSEADKLWWDVEARSFQAYLTGNVELGVEILTDFLKSETASPFRARALGNRAEFFLALGKAEEARQDLTEALHIAGEASYVRFTNEFALGSLYEQIGDRQRAIEYLLRALETALQEGGTSTGGVLVRLLRLAAAGDFSPQAKQLMNAAAIHSWRLLNLPGAPNLSMIEETAEVLLKESSKPQ